MQQLCRLAPKAGKSPLHHLLHRVPVQARCMAEVHDLAAKQLHMMDAHEIVKLLREQVVTPLELIDVVEARVAATDGAVNATPITCFEHARSLAKALGPPPCPPPPGYLYGLPVLIKDTMEVKGMRCTYGSPIWENFIPSESHIVVRQLEARGAVIVGKTNVPEFAAGSQSFNPLFGTTVSPWDTWTTAGGSSGGSAAALACCQCWLASGSDLGGSLRTPAAFCGVVGFRPSPGRVPLNEIGTHSGPLLGCHATNGPLARCVRDIGLFLDAIHGNEGWDFSQPPLEEGDTWEAIAVRGAEGCSNVPNVAFSKLGQTYTEPVETLCRQAAGILAGKPESTLHEVLQDTLDFQRAERAFYVLRGCMFNESFKPILEDADKAQKLKPEILWNCSVGAVPDATDLKATALEDMQVLAGQVASLFENIDILCTPATLDAAFDADIRYPTELAGQTFSNYLGWMLPASIVTMMLCPALVLPCGFLADGRPVGLQLVGAPGCDAQVLKAAAALESRLQLPKACPVPRQSRAPPETKGPRTPDEAARHHQGEVQRLVERYSQARL